MTTDKKPNTLGIIQARMNSSRLPGKVLKHILGKPMIYWIYQRARKAILLDKLVVSTSSESSDDELADDLEKLEIPCFRGSLDDVLGRFVATNKEFGPADIIVRLTGDNPLIDANMIDKLIGVFEHDKLQYACMDAYPYGYFAEIISANALKTANLETSSEYDREHVTPFIVKRPERFSFGKMKSPENLSGHRWTVDYPEDFEFTKQVFNILGTDGADFSKNDILQLIRDKPELLKINSSRISS